MKYTTESFAVQTALGISVQGMSNEPFRLADEQNASRLQHFQKDGCEAVLVDGNMVYLSVEGQDADVSDAATNAEWIEFFKS